MTSSLEINGKKMHSIKYASGHAGYSHDYVTKLAREGKIVATQIGRNWFVDLDSLEHYATIMRTEQLLRQQQLSDERKRERQLREMVEKKAALRTQYRRRLALRSKVLTSLVLVLGLATGFALSRMPLISTEINRQVASAPLLQQKSPNNADVVSATEAVSPAEADHLNFSDETFQLSTLSEANNGILILPNATSSDPVDVTEFFSDDVKVLTDEHGVEYVAQVNENGEVGEKIPFVVVPVIKEKTP